MYGECLGLNRCNSLSCMVRTSRQRLFNQRVGCLFGVTSLNTLCDCTPIHMLSMLKRTCNRSLKEVIILQKLNRNKYLTSQICYFKYEIIRCFAKTPTLVSSPNTPGWFVFANNLAQFFLEHSFSSPHAHNSTRAFFAPCCVNAAFSFLCKLPPLGTEWGLMFK